MSNPSNPPSTVPSTFSVVATAYKEAGVGKGLDAAETAMLNQIKQQLKSHPIGKDLPDHPMYDRILLTFGTMLGRELLLRVPEALPLPTPAKDWGVWAFDCTIRTQAVRNMDDMGDWIGDIGKTAVNSIMGFGGAGLIATVQAEYETTQKIREEVEITK